MNMRTLDIERAVIRHSVKQAGDRARAELGLPRREYVEARERFEQQHAAIREFRKAMARLIERLSE